MGSKWYYDQAGKKQGPVSQGSLVDLLESGVISEETLACPEGSADWRPVRYVLETEAGLSASMPPLESRGTHMMDPAQGIKRTPVILVILFTFLTCGIYYPCWFLTRRSAINVLDSKYKLNKGVFVAAIVVFSVSVALALVGGALQGLGEDLNKVRYVQIASWVDAVDSVLSVILSLVMLWQCFRVQFIFKQHFSKQPGKAQSFSNLATFFFQHMYLQYKINGFYAP